MKRAAPCLLLLSVAGAAAWISRPQALLGATIKQIQDQVNGKAKQGNVATQAGLGFLWSYNPEGKMGASGTPSDQKRERLMGLGGGITWAWDPKLCEKIMPRFYEDAIIYQNLVDCAGVKAAVSRAFNNCASNLLELCPRSSSCALPLSSNPIGRRSPSHRGRKQPLHPLS